MQKYSDLNANFAFHELPEEFLLLIGRIVGAVLGSAVSIAYVLPKGRREAAIRFVVGFILGITFGPACGLKVAHHFEVAEHLSRFEVALMGATTASLCAWWVLGVVRNVLVSREKTSQPGK